MKSFLKTGKLTQTGKCEFDHCKYVNFFTSIVEYFPRSWIYHVFTEEPNSNECKGIVNWFSNLLKEKEMKEILITSLLLYMSLSVLQRRHWILPGTPSCLTWINWKLRVLKNCMSLMRTVGKLIVHIWTKESKLLPPTI